MKKISSFILSLVLFIFVSGCAGYEPIFGSLKNLKFEIAEYSIEGDKVLGKRIYSRLRKFSAPGKNNLDARSVKLLIDVSKNKNATVKDNTGKILEYRITLNTKVQMNDFLTNDSILNQSFVYSVTYKIQDQQSETLKLENKTTENIIDKIYQELLIKLSQNI